MKILVCGGRDYGWKYDEKGLRTPNYEEREKLCRILDNAYSEFEKRAKRRNIDINDSPVWSSDSASSSDDGQHTSLSFRETGSRFVLINGGARGADELAKAWGEVNPFVIVETYYADWKRHKKAAGPIRNQLMLKEGKPNAVIAFPGGVGTAHMVSISKKAGVPVLEVK